MPSLSDLINANTNQFNFLPSTLPGGFSPQKLAEVEKIANELEGTPDGEFFFTLIEANATVEELQETARTYRNPEMITFIEMRYDLSQYQCDEVIELAERLHDKVKIPLKELVNMRLYVIWIGHILMMSQIEDDMNYDMVKKFSYNKKNSKTDSESNLTLLDNFPTEKKSQFYEAYLEKILRVKPMTAKQKADVVKDMKKARSRFVFLKKEQTFFPRVTPRVSSRLSYKYQCYYALELVRRWLAYQGEEPTEILLEWYYMPLAQAIMMNEKEVYVLQNIFRFFEKCRTTLSIAPWDYRKQIWLSLIVAFALKRNWPFRWIFAGIEDYMDTIEKQKDLHQTFLECFDYLNRECLERSPELNSPQISDNIFFAQYTKVKFTKEDYKNWDAMLENMNNTYLFKKYHKALAHHKDFFRYKFNTLCLRQGKLTDEVRDCKYLTSQQFHHYEKEIEKVYQDGIALVKSEYPASEIEEKLGMLQRNKDSFLQLCKSKLKK